MRLTKRSGVVSIGVGLLVASMTLSVSAASASGTSGPASSSGSSGATAGVLAGHTMNGQPIPCVAQADGVQVCHGDESGSTATDLRLKSFDGAPLDIYVALPPAGPSGAHRRYPLILESHGWGDPPSGPNDAQYGVLTPDQWAQQGYAVVQLAARGWGDSCGSPASRSVDPAACVNDYIHLDDYRYEARDAQNVAGLLVDEGLVKPNRIGAAGESYGGGVTLELATLNDRAMLPSGQLVRWRSPRGIPLHIAAAAPYAAFSDLVNSLAPNGRTVDNGLTPTLADLSPAGVEKESIATGLYEVGLLEGSYAPPGVTLDNEPVWYQALTAGEPYDTPTDTAILQTIAQYHSPYYLLAGAFGMRSEAPAPIFMGNGFTDDIFPVNEALRYYNLERSLYPSDPIALYDFDGGHQRGQNRAADLTELVQRGQAFLAHYLGEGAPRPTLGVTVRTEVCPKTVPSDGPYHASTWAGLTDGKVTYASRPAQTILSNAGSLSISETFDPVLGGGACATAPADDQAGVANYRLPAATGAGYTLIGSPTVTADLNVTGTGAYIAERLLDVDPATNTETLVARGVYRIDPGAPNGRQTFQLNPGAWHFAAGHIPKLELLGRDTPYTRPSNGTFSISVSHLRLRLPVRR
jgi:hypothetical protein